MKVIPKHKSKKLWLLRWDKVKESPWVWGIMLVCLVVPIFCHCEYINNICYGYIAGFIFYVLSQFLPETKKELEAKMRILTAVEAIEGYMQTFEEELLGSSYGENKHDDYLLASHMVNEPICRMDYVENVTDLLLTLRQDVVLLSDLCNKQIQENMKTLTFAEAKWVDPELNWALRLICGYMTFDKSIGKRNPITFTGGEISLACINFYMGKTMLKHQKELLQKYNYFVEEQ